MRGEIKLTGMVLSSMPIGDYDKRIVLLTKERGKITAFVKGARRPNSPLLAAANPMSFGEFVLYEGRTSYQVKSSHIREYFPELRNDLDRLYYGFYVLEMAEYFTQEYSDERDVLKLLYQTLRILQKNTVPKELIRRIYEIKILSYEGIGIQVFSCIHCGSKKVRYFQAKAGGCYCEDCRPDRSVLKTTRLEDDVLYTLQYILTSSVEHLYTFRVSEKVQQKLDEIMTVFLKFHVEKEFQSEMFLRL